MFEVISMACFLLIALCMFEMDCSITDFCIVNVCVWNPSSTEDGFFVGWRWGRTVRQQAERAVFGASGGYAGRTSGPVPAWVSGECGGAVGSGGRGGCGKRGSRSGATRAADIVADCGAARSKKTPAHRSEGQADKWSAGG